MKHLHEDNSIISGLFSQNNLLLRSMYKVMMGFYRKRSKNFQNIITFPASRFSLLTSPKFVVEAQLSKCLNLFDGVITMCLKTFKDV